MQNINDVTQHSQFLFSHISNTVYPCQETALSDMFHPYRLSHVDFYELTALLSYLYGLSHVDFYKLTVLLSWLNEN